MRPAEPRVRRFAAEACVFATSPSHAATSRTYARRLGLAGQQTDRSSRCRWGRGRRGRCAGGGREGGGPTARLAVRSSGARIPSQLRRSSLCLLKLSSLVGSTPRSASPAPVYAPQPPPDPLALAPSAFDPFPPSRPPAVNNARADNSHVSLRSPAGGANQERDQGEADRKGLQDVSTLYNRRPELGDRSSGCRRNGRGRRLQLLTAGMWTAGILLLCRLMRCTM